jgi:hypothetical protein
MKQATRLCVIPGSIVLALSGCAPAGVSSPHPPAKPATRSGVSSSSCPPQLKLRSGSDIAIDYVDTLRLVDHDYLAAPEGALTHWTPSQIGPLLGQIKCMLSAYLVDPNYPLGNGDATFLPPGTPVFFATTKPHSTDVVAKVSGRWRLYQQLPKS